MKRRTTIIIISGMIGILVGTGYMMKIQAIRNRITGIQETVQVLTTRNPLSIGDTLSGENLSATGFPKAHLPKRAILAADMELINGRTLIHPVPQGDPILWTDLPEGPRIHYPTEKIPSGVRAMALPASEVQTLAHLLSPGDRVDMVWTCFVDGSAQPASTILGEAIPILAVGNWIRPERPDRLGDDFPSSITLMVDRKLALKVASAMQNGQITLIARTRGDYR